MVMMGGMKVGLVVLVVVVVVGGGWWFWQKSYLYGVQDLGLVVEIGSEEVFVFIDCKLWMFDGLLVIVVSFIQLLDCKQDFGVLFKVIESVIFDFKVKNLFMFDVKLVEVCWVFGDNLCVFYLFYVMLEWQFYIVIDVGVVVVNGVKLLVM